MLDLNKLINQIQEMSTSRLDTYKNVRDRLALAKDMLTEDAYTFEKLAEKSRLAKTSWLIAQPTENFKVYKLPQPPTFFQVLAVDGSQIVPDHHEISLCYLINTGGVLLTYGVLVPPLMESVPKLYYKEEDLYYEFKGRKQLIQGELFAAKRTSVESEQLISLMRKANENNLPTMGMFDGTLIQWNLESKGQEDGDFKDELLNNFLAPFSEAKKLKIPIIGYISGSRSNDVLNLLRLGLCPEYAPNCDKCKLGAMSPCCEIEGLTDVNLFKDLRLGERTSVFYSSSKVLKKYKEHKVGFFYLKVDSEVARIEAPKWVLDNAEYLDLIHTLAFDQARKGYGYPVVLSEAHELAVIKGRERELFFNLLAEFYVHKGISVEVSSKSLSKRRPLV